MGNVWNAVETHLHKHICLLECQKFHQLESVFADFFMERSFQYLVAGDRLSGRVEIYQSKPGSPSKGASELVASLRKLFLNFGIPEILSSDVDPSSLLLKHRIF